MTAVITFSEQMRQVADQLAMISRVYGEDADARWSATELRTRAADLETPIPGVKAVTR